MADMTGGHKVKGYNFGLQWNQPDFFVFFDTLAVDK